MASTGQFDVFKGQCTEAVPSLLEKNNIHIVAVPANTTNRLLGNWMERQQASRGLPQGQVQ